MKDLRVPELDGTTIGANINDFKHVELVSNKEAQEKLGVFRFKHIYKGNKLLFQGHEVSNIGLSVKDSTGIVDRFRFEIPYEDNQIFHDLFELYGVPHTIIPKEPPYLNSQENIDYFKAYGLENCVEFSWYNEGEDFFITAINLLDYSDCYPNKKQVVWITYRELKER